MVDYDEENNDLSQQPQQQQQHGLMLQQQRQHQQQQGLPSVVNYETDLKNHPSPEKYWTFYRPFGLLFVVVPLLSVLAVSIVCFVTPVMLFVSLVRRCVTASTTTKRSPENLRIAVVGGGWGGLQILDRLRELGVRSLSGFERYDDVGGTWHPGRAYYGQAIHAPMWISSFANFAHGDPHSKLIASGIQDYNLRYAETKDLRQYYRFDSTVKSIWYDTNANVATLEVEKKTRAGPEGEGEEDAVVEVEKHGPYDMVLYTSLNSDPIVPDFPGMRDKFCGKVLHSTQFTRDVFVDIVANKRKVVVVGGGKTALDLLIPFVNTDYCSDDNVSWVYRRPYSFFKMEHVFGPPSVSKVFFGSCFLLTIFATLVSARLSNAIAWCSGMLWTYHHEDSSSRSWWLSRLSHVCKAAQMDKLQRESMNRFPNRNKFWASIERFEENGLWLSLRGGGKKNETNKTKFVEADVVLMATSLGSGVQNLKLFKDGVPFAYDPDEFLIDGFTCSSFPVLGFHGATLTFGPQRARATGDLAVYHSCCSSASAGKKPLLPRRTVFQFGPLFRVGNAVHVWGNSTAGDNALKLFSTQVVSFVMSGMVDYFDILVAVIKLACFAKQDPFDLSILPPSIFSSVASVASKRQQQQQQQAEEEQTTK